MHKRVVLFASLRHEEKEIRKGIELIDESKVLMVPESLPCASDVDPTLKMDMGDSIPVRVAEMIGKHEDAPHALPPKDPKVPHEKEQLPMSEAMEKAPEDDPGVP